MNMSREVQRCVECGNVTLSLDVVDYLLRLITVEGALDEESRHLEEEDSGAYSKAIDQLEAMRA